MKIGFIGLTHLGLNYLAATAEKKFKVIGFDDDQKKINDLNNFKINIKEPGLKNSIIKNKKKISFTTQFKKISDLNLVFISPDLKTDKYGNIDTSYLKKLISKSLKFIKKKASLIILSQIRPGFMKSVNFDNKRLFYQVETLVFGLALKRAIYPERIIIGSKKKNLTKEYKTFLKTFKCPIILMNYKSAELTKIAINLYLSSTLTTTNFLARASKQINASWEDITKALKLDKRIGKYAYLNKGLGISGGNLERDLFSIKKIMHKDLNGTNYINSIIKNSKQMKSWPINTIKKKITKNTKLGIFGLSYKDKINSIKNSPSLDLINRFKKNKIYVYDPHVTYINKMLEIEKLSKLEEIMIKSDIWFFMKKWENINDFKKKMKKVKINEKIIVDPFGIFDEKMKFKCREYHSI